MLLKAGPIFKTYKKILLDLMISKTALTINKQTAALTAVCLFRKRIASTKAKCLNSYMKQQFYQ